MAFILVFGALADRASAQGSVVALGSGGGSFVENRGQWDAAAAMRGVFGPVSVWLERGGWILVAEERTGFKDGPHRRNDGGPLPVVTTRGAAVRMRFLGARGVLPVAEEALEVRHNWFKGNDPAGWVTDVRAFKQARFSGLYPGVSAVAREEKGRFEYDVIVEPGADLGVLSISCEGQDAFSVDDKGDLILSTRHGVLRQTAPVAWEEEASGARASVDCAWRVLDANRVTFEVGPRHADRRLVIDPGVLWSNLFGGIDNEDPGLEAIEISPSGNVNVGGVVVSTTFPTTLGAYQTSLQGAGTWDAWVARFSPSGTMLWSTYYGGSGWEFARGLAIGTNDTVTVVGDSSSVNLPFVNGFDSTYNGTGQFGWGDAFLATFNPSLTGTAQLVWATYLGGINDDRFNSVSVDPVSGLVTAAGWTYSSNVPGITPPNAFQPSFQNLQDGMVARFDPNLPGLAQLTWFTFLGGSSYDYLGPIFVSGPNVVVTGGTQSTNFPTANPLQPMLSGLWDTTLTVLNPSLPPASQLVYSTYFGGSFNDNEAGVAVDAFGRITVAGFTTSANFPTTPGALDTSYNFGVDAYVSRINPLAPPASQLVYSTYIGGSGDDNINDIELDPSGGVHAVGSTASGNFPTTPGAYQTAFQGGGPAGWGPFDAFALVLDPTGTTLAYSTYIGGTAAYEFAYNLVRDPCGNVYVSGLTRSSDFPHSSGTFNGLDDVFLLKADLLPTGVMRYGASTPGCLGPLEIGVISNPANGNPWFALTCAGAPTLSTGLLGLAPGALNPPLIVGGVSVWVDMLNPASALLPIPSGAFGQALVPVPIPSGPGLVGVTAYLQFAWADACATGGISASCALQVTIQ